MASFVLVKSFSSLVTNAEEWLMNTNEIQLTKQKREKAGEEMWHWQDDCGMAYHHKVALLKHLI